MEAAVCLQVGGLLLGAVRQVLIALGDFARSGGNFVGGRFELADQRLQVWLMRCNALSNSPISSFECTVNAAGQVALRHGVGDGDGLAQWACDRAGDEPRQQGCNHGGAKVDAD